MWIILLLLLLLPAQAQFQLRDARGALKGPCFPGMVLPDGHFAASGAVLRGSGLTLGLVGECDLKGSSCSLLSGTLYYQGKGVLGGLVVDGEGVLTSDGRLAIVSGTAGRGATWSASEARTALGPLWPYFRAGGEPLWERVLAAEAVAYDPAALKPPARVSTGMGVSYSSATSSGPAPTLSGGGLSNTTSSGGVAVDYPIGLAPLGDTVRGTPVLRWLTFPRAAQYVVLVSRDNFATLAWTGRVTGTSATPLALPAGEYSWRVAALDGAGRVLGRASEAGFTIAR